MVSAKPYLIRGLYQWIVDIKLTPYLLVDCSHADVIVPKDFIKQNEIVLNVEDNAVVNLELDNEFVSFSARFNEVSQDLFIPMNAVKAIYSQENNQGMWFDTDIKETVVEKNTTTENKPKLKLV